MTDPIREPTTDESESFPALKHRPPKVSQPAPTAALSGVRSTLLKNSEVTLTTHAAGVVTGGLVDPARFKVLVDPTIGHGTEAPFLNRRPVTGGEIFLTPEHQRYLDLGVLPDILFAGRWKHRVYNRLTTEAGDDRPSYRPALTSTGEPLTVIDVELRDYAALETEIRRAFTMTSLEGSDVPNDYRDSILQSGVKEPLTLVVVRIHFTSDGSDAHYLMAIDGNSRLVSSWRARTGGTVDEAATACIRAVVGEKAGGRWKPTTQRVARAAVSGLVERVNLGLNEERLTEATIRNGQTLTVPARVIVGGRAAGDGALDLVAACRDVLATIHENTPWTPPAKSTQAMARVLDRAVKAGLITPNVRDIVEGRHTPDEMNRLLGLPPHRLLAAALSVQAILSAWDKESKGTSLKRIFCEEFNLVVPKRISVSSRLAATALSGYLDHSNYKVAFNAFQAAGPITDTVWSHGWHLRKADEPVEALDAVLNDALAGISAAKAELIVLGGIAAMMMGLLTRDRGSKQIAPGQTKQAGKVPVRHEVDRVLEELASTHGGLRILHSIAVAHVMGDRPAKLFHTSQEDGRDGQPVIDNAGAHVSLEVEWDIVVAAYPAESAEALTTEPTDGGQQPTVPEQVRLRKQLKEGAEATHKAAQRLAELKQSSGVGVFGTPESIDMIKWHLAEARDVLLVEAKALQNTAVEVADDEDEDESDEVA